MHAPPINGKMPRKRKPRCAQPDLGSLRRALEARGWNPRLTDESYEWILRAGLRGENIALAAAATEILFDEQSITLRGWFYRVVSAGWLPSTDKEHYNRLKRLSRTLRRAGIVPYEWLVDGMRATQKPSSWSGLESFLDTVKDAYRKDFWASLPAYPHIICEKDALTSVIEPVTREFNVALSPIRGYVSLTFVHEISKTWNRIKKPIHAYYLGDHDPSGRDLEQNLRDNLTEFCGNRFTWIRLGVDEVDFDRFDLLPLKPKTKDSRFRQFTARYGDRCAEVDALPATELRRRVEAAIMLHIPPGEWERLERVERLEREAFEQTIGNSPRVTVNGRTFTGPLYVSRSTLLRETSVLPVGADASTSVNLAAAAVTNIGATDMTFETWCEGQGIDPSMLSDSAKAALMTVFEAEAGATPAAPPAAAAAHLDLTAGGHVATLRRTTGAELRRQAEIRAKCGGDDLVAAKAIEAGWTAEQAEIEALKRRRPPAPSNRIPSNGGEGMDQKTLEACFALRTGREESAVKALGERAVESARRVRNRSFLDLCAMACMIDGREAPHGANQLIKAAFSTVSLPTTLSNVMGRTLTEAYMEAPSTWRSFAKVPPAADFREQKTLRPNAIKNLEQVGKAGEVKHASLTEGDSYT